MIFVALPFGQKFIEFKFKDRGLIGGFNFNRIIQHDFTFKQNYKTIESKLQLCASINNLISQIDIMVKNLYL